MTGYRPKCLLVKVFINAGGDGANYDYGYRGTPTYVDLGFDASQKSHCFKIEWSPFKVRWLVDGKVVHERFIWNPTPIPDLPMTFHFNSWVTRSSQLAGKIKNGLLPSETILRNLSVKARPIISTSSESRDQSLKSKPNILNSRQLIK